MKTKKKSISTDLEWSSIMGNTPPITTDSSLDYSNLSTYGQLLHPGTNSINGNLLTGLSTTGSLTTSSLSNSTTTNIKTIWSDDSVYDYSKYSNKYAWTKPNELASLSYVIEFLLDTEKMQLLVEYIDSIDDEYFTFKCDSIEHRIQPYEYIMSLIENKTSFSIKIKISDILTLCYTNCRFTKIRNNFNFNDGFCDFSKLKVNFECDDILYENNKLPIKEKRIDKLNKIIKNNNE